MCSEIKICAEQRCLSSSTSDTAFAGTLYRERTNTSIFIASSKLSLTSTNFIQNLFWVTKHRLCTKTHNQLVVKLYVAHNFSFKIVICTYTQNTPMRQNQLQFVVVFWTPIKFEIWDFVLRTFTSLCSAPPTSRYQTHQDFTRSEKNIFKSSQF